MAFNQSKPATTDNYVSEFTQNIQANFVALALMLDSNFASISGSPPTYAKRYNRTSKFFEEYSGTAWGNLLVNIPGNAATATTASSTPYSGLTGTVPTWNQNTTGNAATATNVAYSGLTGTVPIWNQNTTGNAATATNATNASNATTAGSLTTTNFSIVQSGSKLYFRYGATLIASIDAAGNFVVANDVTAFGGV
jgi:hypothetical protein